MRQILIAVLLALAGLGVGLTLGYTWRPQPNESEQWQRGFRFGYETGLHDARGPRQNTLLPAPFGGRTTDGP